MNRLSSSRRPGHSSRQRSLHLEPLEARLALSTVGLVDVGAQPSGALDGKIVYVHGGHGITYGTYGWGYQRPLLLDMVEDLGNQDQMTQLVDQLWNAGATVVPLRPVGHQTNEVILDNDDVQVTFTGAWSNSSAGVYFGDAGDVPYRYASTSATETATAEYRPDIPEAGYYPVYAWTRYGSDRAADQLYRVHHAGGATEVTVNHRQVGNGLVYLGSYYFEEGTEGSVEISNLSSESGKVVIADMIRFGNGMGDVSIGGSASGQPRENEAALYWLQWHVEHSQGVPSSTYGTSTVSAPTKYATYMNRAADGALSDRVFISYHSNAGSGSSRGVIGLHNTSSGGATPNQFDLAYTVAQEINDDLVAQDGQFEHDWYDRGSSLTYQASFNYGEINNSVIGGEFDATIIETAFHDNSYDAELMRDPDVREAIATATLQGVVDYFRSVDGNATSDVDLPGRVTDLQVESTGEGAVTLNWDAPAVNSYNGGAASGYVIYASTGGYGFDGGRVIASGATTSAILTGLDPEETYYFKVVATNAGGASFGSEVVAAKAAVGGEKVLIVNGFDRLDRQQNPTQAVGSGQAERVRPQESNSYDYAVQMASAIDGASSGVTIDTTANELVASGEVDLSDYDAVFWILGEESTGDNTFDASEQAAVAAYMNAGGSLFVSGAEIGWELDHLNAGRSFYNDTLRAAYAADDANTYSVTGAAGSIFEGLSFSFDDGSLFYDTEYADVIAPRTGATAALNYSSGAGAAAVQYNDGQQKLVMLAFPFETITSADTRTQVMQQVLDYFEVDGDSVPTITIDKVLDNDDGAAVYTDADGWLTSSDPGYSGGSFRFNLVGSEGQAQWRTDLPLAGTAEVYVQYAAGSNRASGVAYLVTSGAETLDATIDQTTNSLEWVLLGSLPVEAGELTVTLDVGASTGSQYSLIVADAVRVVLSAPAEPSGDFNHDLSVDAADYSVWRDQLGQSVAVGTGADGNFDGVVDQADYQLWREQFGTVIAPTPVAIEAIEHTEPALVAETISAAEPLKDPSERQVYLAPPRLASAFDSPAAQSHKHRDQVLAHRRLEPWHEPIAEGNRLRMPPTAEDFDFAGHDAPATENPEQVDEAFELMGEGSLDLWID